MRERNVKKSVKKRGISGGDEPVLLEDGGQLLKLLDNRLKGLRLRLRA
jgi:hypothetical protein